MPGRQSYLCLLARPAHEVTLPNRDPLPAEDVVGRRSVEVEIRLREREQEILGGVIDMAVTERKAHIPADERDLICSANAARVYGFA